MGITIHFILFFFFKGIFLAINRISVIIIILILIFENQLIFGW